MKKYIWAKRDGKDVLEEINIMKKFVFTSEDGKDFIDVYHFKEGDLIEHYNELNFGQLYNRLKFLSTSGRLNYNISFLNYGVALNSNNELIYGKAISLCSVIDLMNKIKFINSKDTALVVKHISKTCSQLAGIRGLYVDDLYKRISIVPIGICGQPLYTSLKLL